MKFRNGSEDVYQIALTRYRVYWLAEKRGGLRFSQFIGQIGNCQLLQKNFAPQSCVFKLGSVSLELVARKYLNIFQL
jgi:hypothetical protein